MENNIVTEEGITERFFEYLENNTVNFPWVREVYSTFRLQYEEDGVFIDSPDILRTKKFDTWWEPEQEHDKYNWYSDKDCNVRCPHSAVSEGTIWGNKYSLTRLDEQALFKRFIDEFTLYLEDSYGVAIREFLITQRLCSLDIQPRPGIMLRFNKRPKEQIIKHINYLASKTA